MAIKKKNDFDIFEEHLEDKFRFIDNFSSHTDKNKTGNKKIKTIFYVFIPISLVLISLSVFLLIKNHLDNTQLDILEEENIIATIQNEEPVSNIRSEILEARNIFENDDIIGYIEFRTPGKYSNFVLQTDNNNFYQNHDLNGNISESGVPFLFNVTNLDDKNLILYLDKSAEATNLLRYYLDVNLFTQNKLIYFKDSYYDYTWELFSIYENNSPINTVPIEFSDDDSFYISAINFLQKSMHEIDLAEDYLSTDDYLLTLFITDTNTDVEYILHAKLLERKDFEK